MIALMPQSADQRLEQPARRARPSAGAAAARDGARRGRHPGSASSGRSALIGLDCRGVTASAGVRACVRARRERHVAAVLHDLLAGVGQDPVDVLLHRALRLAERVHVQRAGDGIALVQRVGDGRRDGRLAGLASRPSASSPPAWRSPCRCSRWPSGVEATSSTTSFEPFMSREPSLKSLLAEHVLAEELVGAGAGLPADADDRVVAGARDRDARARTTA